MQSKSKLGTFAALWVLTGLVHAILAILSRDYFMLPFLAFSVLIFPIRSFLLEKILGLQLEDWGGRTAKGAIRGFGAACGAAVVAVLFIFITFRSYTELIYLVPLIGGYASFRLTVIWWQYRQIEKLNRNWLTFNFLSIGLYSLVLWFFLSSTSLFYNALVIQFLGIALSELAVSFAYIKVKQNEVISEKRKVEEM